MARYELVEGTSKKFWEIALSGAKFTVRFGRIGTEGQEQVKSFKTPAEARAAHDKLVAEKTKKGYALAGAKAQKAPKAAAAPKAAVAKKSGDPYSALEEYFAALRAAKPKGLELYDAVLPPQKATAIASAEKTLGTKFPDDLKAFLTRGLKGARGSLDGEPFAALGFGFLPADKLAKHTAMLRKVARDTVDDEDDDHRELIERGVAITYEEPELVVADDGVYHFSFRNPVLKVASSFAEFMTHWHAAGGFSSHSFDALFKRVKPFITSDIPPAKNVWVRAYKKQFPKL